MASASEIKKAFEDFLSDKDGFRKTPRFSYCVDDEHNCLEVNYLYPLMKDYLCRVFITDGWFCVTVTVPFFAEQSALPQLSEFVNRVNDAEAVKSDGYFTMSYEYRGVQYIVPGNCMDNPVGLGQLYRAFDAPHDAFQKYGKDLKYIMQGKIKAADALSLIGS